jgi:disulfide bond formation protein DsbB
MDWVKHARQLLVLMALICLGLLGFGLYLQEVQGLEPCPMCIVQRDAMVAIVLGSLGAAFFKDRSARGHGAWLVGAVWVLVAAVFGAFVAARQSWLQWYPPQVLTCGRDFYGMIEAFPLQRVVPMIFKGSGDCAAVTWTFLGGSIANWSFVCFVGLAVLALVLLLALWQGRRLARRQRIFERP